MKVCIVGAGIQPVIIMPEILAIITDTPQTKLNQDLLLDYDKLNVDLYLESSQVYDTQESFYFVNRLEDKRKKILRMQLPRVFI